MDYFDINAEINLVKYRFRVECSNQKFKTGVPFSNLVNSDNGKIILNLPFWIAKCSDIKVDLNYLRALSLGNLFGAMLILDQDAIMDDEISDHYKSSGSIIQSNILFYKWLKEYQRVFGSSDYFWVLFERYLEEYSNVILWEKQEHWNKLEQYTEKELIKLGQKFSLLKISAAGICILTSSEFLIDKYSACINYYHTGYQLYDDLIDWETDLKRKNLTYLLTKVAYSLGTLKDIKAIKELVNQKSFIESYLSTSSLFYSKSLELADELKAKDLCDHIMKRINSNNLVISQLSDKTKIDSSNAVENSILNLSDKVVNAHHLFKTDQCYFLFDTPRNLGIKIDLDTYEYLKKIHDNNSLDDINIDGKYDDVIKDLIEVGIISQQKLKMDKGFNQDIKKEKINNLGIILDSKILSRNTEYSKNQFTDAVDTLFIRSGYTRKIFLHLFLNVELNKVKDLIIDLLDYSSKLSAKLMKDLHISINIGVNSHVYDSLDKIIELNEFREKVIKLLSERTREIKVRFNLTGEYSSEMCNCALLDNKYLTESGAVSSEKETGTNMEIEKVINRLNKRKIYSHYCNVGKAYIVFGSDGKYYPCHKYAEAGICNEYSAFESFKEIQAEFLENRSEPDEKCISCWCKNLCGGGCYFMKDTDTEFEKNFCLKFKMNVEKAVIERFKNNKREKQIEIVPCDCF